MTEAMQIRVSSEIENRIDDNNSTVARRAGEPDLILRPCVESVMSVFSLTQKKEQAI
jgi:hypothetical protein